MATKKFQEGRIPTRSGYVVVGEGQHQNHRRLSEPAPPRHHTPPPPRAGRTVSPRTVLPADERRALTVVPDIERRRCPKCRTDKAADTFVLLDQSQQTFGALRRWCADCIRASSFAGHRLVKSLLAAMVRRRAEAAAQAAERARFEAAMVHEFTSNATALHLYDRANADPTFAAALRLAASALDFPRADLEAVI